VLGQVFFLILRIHGNEKDRKRLAAKDVDDARSTPLTHTGAGNSHLSKAASSRNNLTAIRVHRQHFNNLLAFRLAENGFSSIELTGRLDDGLHDSFILQWTLFVQSREGAQSKRCQPKGLTLALSLLLYLPIRKSQPQTAFSPASFNAGLQPDSEPEMD